VTGALAEQDILVAGRGKENLPDPFRSESGKRMNCQHRVRRFMLPGEEAWRADWLEAQQS